jgi:tRNA A-37 threonylcarbamoyl transferase component Bud32
VEEGEDDGIDEEVLQLLQLRKAPSPVGLGDLAQLTKLDLPKCGLSSLPEALPEVLPNLSIMFLSGNNFTEMPKIIGDCPQLQMVAFKANALTSIHPEALQSQLRWLILTDNQLEAIPETIGRCKILQKCMLSGNKLKKLPAAISECQNLELIRLSSNRLEEPPLRLLRLPNLCWVACSGNPFIQSSKWNEEASKLKLPILADIAEGTGEILGEGAGGITRKVIHTIDNQQLPVAVKTYCGAMTSDGSPEEERKMSLTVFTKIKSDFLISLHGETPGGSLVMEYLDHYKALAGPPGLESCSRDVYTCDKDFMTEDETISMVSGLLDVLEKMHANGICHGDFYAHNILVSQEERSKVKLSDFGAAFFYDADSEYGKLLQRTELRAFGVLVREVHELFSDRKSSLLEELANSCWDVSASFEAVNAQWKQMCH